jgi:hypothetical protein
VSLPTLWIDRIFQRLTVAYGRDFTARWDGVPIGEVKTDWCQTLGGFRAHPEAIAWALESLPPDRAPTAMQFRELCRKAPAPQRPALPEPPAAPERVRAELARLAPALKTPPAHLIDRKAWAKRIVQNAEAGGRVAGGTLRIARECLQNRNCIT